MRPNPACAVLSAALAALALAAAAAAAATRRAASGRRSRPCSRSPTPTATRPSSSRSQTRCEKRSGGTLKIAFKNRWRPGQSDDEANLIRDVKAGKADLGWAGTRAFDDVGVPAFDALHAPLLIDSLALERAVLESPLAPAMLGGLKPAGVVGLGILPGPLRRPLGVAPLVKPAGLRGRDDRAAALAGGRRDAGGARRTRRAAPGHGHDRGLRRHRAAALLDRRQRLRPDRQPPDRQRGAVAAPLVLFANPKALESPDASASAAR